MAKRRRRGGGGRRRKLDFWSIAITGGLGLLAVGIAWRSRKLGDLVFPRYTPAPDAPAPTEPPLP